MRVMQCVTACLCYAMMCTHLYVHGDDDEADAWKFIRLFDKEFHAAKIELAQANWKYYTNMTYFNKVEMGKEAAVLNDIRQTGAAFAKAFDTGHIQNSTLKRMLNSIMDVGYVNNSKLLSKVSGRQSKMVEMYSDAKWCNTSEDCLSMDPDLEGLMATVRDYDELERMWVGWRNVSGAQMRDLYQTFAELSNQGIKDAGKFEDRGAYLRSWYESDTFEEDVRQLFVELRPLYDQLHAYVRRHLQEYYKNHTFPESGHIPAHIFGNMWAQKWTNIYDILVPYPEVGEHTLTEKMVNQGYNVTFMFQLAHDFYTSLGFEPLPRKFWEKSMLVKPDDGRKVVCHASAWDLHTGDDFRIKQCTTVTGDQLMTVHHEVGHLFYYMAYASQPLLFRSGANPGFHEGVADIALISFQTPEYLKHINLIDEVPEGDEADINLLLKTALDRVAFLPFGYLIDQWRWSVYRGDITPSNYNSEWWKLRCHYQGISPPVLRTEDMFDPGAKYHIPGDYPYIRYFVSYVVQFQWHKALCEIIGHKGPLHRCSLYNQTAAGDRLWSMLRMGSSRPWGEAMRVLTRGTSVETDTLSASALLDYFKPLQEWLEKENKRTGQDVGWDRSVCPNVKGPDPTTSSSPKHGTHTAPLTIIVGLYCLVIGQLV